MATRIFYILLILLMLVSGEAFSQNASPDSVVINASATVTAPSVGDSLTIFVDVSIPPDFRVSESAVSFDSDGLSVDSQDYDRIDLQSGGYFERYSLHAYVIATDTLSVGPFSVEYVSPDSTSAVAVSNTLIIPVNSVLNITDPNKPPEPNPNRPPLPIEKQGLPWWIYALAALVIVGAIVLVRYYRTRSNASPAGIPVLDQPIDELEEFEKIRRLALHEKGELRELYIRVSDAMRGFLHRQLPFEALYDTSGEILMELDRYITDRNIYNEIRDVLIESDMVKFAKYAPDADKSSTIIDRAIKPVSLILEEKKRERERLEREQEAKKAAENQNLQPSMKSTDGNGGDAT